MSKLRIVVVFILAYGLGALSYRQYHLFRESQDPLGKVLHVGILVPDLDQAIKLWRGMGFHKITVLPETETLAEYHGQPIDIQMKKAFVEDMIPQVELMQPVTSKPNPWADELHEKGEVLHHIAFHVADAPAEMKALNKLGLREIAGSRTDVQPGALTWNYMKAPDSALIVELLSNAPAK